MASGGDRLPGVVATGAEEIGAGEADDGGGRRTSFGGGVPPPPHATARRAGKTIQEGRGIAAS
jgi:hypothetical protein